MPLALAYMVLSEHLHNEEEKNNAIKEASDLLKRAGRYQNKISALREVYVSNN